MASPYFVPKFTKQMVVMVSKPVNDHIEMIAEKQGLSKSSVVRALIQAGFKVAGYGDVPTTDEPENYPHIVK